MFKCPQRVRRATYYYFRQAYFINGLQSPLHPRSPNPIEGILSSKSRFVNISTGKFDMLFERFMLQVFLSQIVFSRLVFVHRIMIF